MKRPQRPVVDLEEPRQALLGYLQNLLDEVPEHGRGAAPKPAATPVVERPAAVEVPPAVQPAAAPAPPPPAPHTVEAAPAVPEWGRRPFQAIGFEVAGITLCMPLERLRGIVRWDGAASRLPGMPPWQLGVLRVRGRPLVVIDFARLLMPDKACAGACGHVLVLEGERWGLACERIAATLDLQPEAVRWRRTRGRPPYLVGVVRESLVPIVGVEEVLERVGTG